MFKPCNLFIDRPNTAVPKNAFNNLLNVQIELEFENLLFVGVVKGTKGQVM